MDSMLWIWIGFNLFVLAMLALDLGVFHRKAHDVSEPRERSLWSVAVGSRWRSAFNVVLYFWRGRRGRPAVPHRLLIEESLSVDNIFVFVPDLHLLRVRDLPAPASSSTGSSARLLMRGLMIAAGAALIKEFHWIIYVFGAFLIFTGIRHGRSTGNEAMHPEQIRSSSSSGGVIPVTPEYHGQRFFVRQAGVPDGDARSS
jgi:tellurite resistance protein TerC